MRQGDLIIAGGRPRGVLYGVYGFLRDVPGFRFFAPDCTFVPKSDEITLDDGLFLRDKPDFKYRETNYAHVFADGDFAARSRQNGGISRLGGVFKIPLKVLKNKEAGSEWTAPAREKMHFWTLPMLF